MEVYILISDWNYSGNTSVNMIEGVFSTLTNAQVALGDLVNLDLQYCDLPNYQDDCEDKEFDLYEAVRTNKPFPATFVRIDDGLELPEYWVEHHIEKRIVL